MIDFWYPLDSKELVIVVILFIRVIPVEVGHDDGDGEGDAQGAADAADAGHQLARGGGGGDVTVPRAGHCDDGPVQRLRQCEEHRVRLVLGGEK